MKLFTNLFTVLYPVVFFMGREWPPYLMSSILLGVAILNLSLLVMMKKWTDIFVPVVFFFIGTMSFFISSDVIFKMVPAVISFYFLVLFGKANFADKTMIQVFASIRHKGSFDDMEIEYFKKLNWVWTWFLVINVMIQIIMIFMPLYLWVLYSTVISYVLMGILFMVEFGYRKLIWEPKRR